MKQNKWHFSLFGCPVGRYETAESDEEAIAHAISVTPAADYFISIVNIDQVIQCINYRDRSTDIALCFWGERGTQNDALLKQLESGEIDHFSYDYSWAEASIYKPLWQVVKTFGIAIKDFWEQQKWSCNWTSERDFFAEVIQEVLEKEFITCFRRYIYNASEMDTIAVLKHKQHKGTITKSQLKKLYTLIDKSQCFSPKFNRLLLTIKVIAEENGTAMGLLQEYRDSLHFLSKLQLKGERQTAIRRIHYRPSETWNEGSRE